MIPRDAELAVAANLRQIILDLVTGVTDASGLHYDDHSPNWLTQKRIGTAARDFARDLSRLGAIAIEAHAPCGAPAHEGAAFPLDGAPGYWRIVVPGSDDVSVHPVPGDTNLFRHAGQIYRVEAHALLSTQSVETAPCPCRPGRLTREHSVCRHFAVPDDPDSRLATLSWFQFELLQAAEMATDKRRRSAIREKLLMTLLELERLIVPQTAETHATQRLRTPSR